MWSDWTWGECSKSCGNGTQNGTRTISQAAQHGGSNCTGSSTSTQSCNTNACPRNGENGTLFIEFPIVSCCFSVNCTWSDWTWDSCSKSCGNGTQNGSRTISQSAMNGGSECSGPSADSQSCNSHICPKKPGEGKFL